MQQQSLITLLASATGVLLRHVENVAHELLFTRLTLNASLNSVPFYKAQGYCAGPRGMRATTSGLQIARVHMEKI